MFKQQSPDGSKNPVELTGREIEILSMLSEGMSYKMMADASNITFHTINSHLEKIYEKLHVHFATEAVSKVFSTANRLGLDNRKEL